jgi:hypothetical protein
MGFGAALFLVGEADTKNCPKWKKAALQTGHDENEPIASTGSDTAPCRNYTSSKGSRSLSYQSLE